MCNYHQFVLGNFCVVCFGCLLPTTYVVRGKVIFSVSLMHDALGQGGDLSSPRTGRETPRTQSNCTPSDRTGRESLTLHLVPSPETGWPPPLGQTGNSTLSGKRPHPSGRIDQSRRRPLLSVWKTSQEGGSSFRQEGLVRKEAPLLPRQHTHRLTGGTGTGCGGRYASYSKTFLFWLFTVKSKKSCCARRNEITRTSVLSLWKATNARFLPPTFRGDAGRKCFHRCVPIHWGGGVYPIYIP